PPSAATPAPPEHLPATFTPKGAVLGAPAEASNVTLQALRPGAVILRGADGKVYFARQLAAGDAYRAPAVAGLTVDVSDPTAFQVFVGGQSKGVLPLPQTPLSRLTN
ncbi:MAG TPA: RodZ domain-containing protein, partial [Phenylobacterium sp.]